MDNIIYITYEDATYALLPCPFVHTNEEAHGLSIHSQSMKYVVCQGCRTTGPVRAKVSEAVIAWNERVTDPRYNEELFGFGTFDEAYPALIARYWLKRLVKGSEADAAYLYYKLSREPNFLHWSLNAIEFWAKKTCRDAGYEYLEDLHFTYSLEEIE